MKIDRRTLLASAAAIGMGWGEAGRSALASPTRALLSAAEFKRRLRGPIVTIPTPFTPDEKVDYQGVGSIIRRAQAHGMQIFELTAGDARLLFLSYEEIKELTRVVAGLVGPNGITIAGTGFWWTTRVVDFVRYAESVGVSAVQVLIPSDGDDDGYVRHFQEIARATRLPLVLHGHFSMPLLERLVEIDSIAAMKEDVSMNYFIDTILRFGQRINCFAGGSGEWFLVAQPYGATAYFDNFASFAPEISARFWKAVQANDIAAEVEIIEKYDHPWLEHFSHPFWHATLEYFDVAQRYLRLPQHTYTDQEMKQVKTFYDNLHLYPDSST
jgi:4-hydroxy-tetrahydrodipicolinate synthase